MTTDKYLEYIPQTWTTCNARNDYPLEPGLMWEMMVISTLNYQVDEFLEAVVGRREKHELEAVRKIIIGTCDAHFPVPATKETCNTLKRRRSLEIQESGNGVKRPKVTVDEVLNGNGVAITTTTTPDTSLNLNRITQVLSKFITYVLTHPAVLSSAPESQTALRDELKIFLLAHITDLASSHRLTQQASYSPSHATKVLTPPSTYYTWVTTTSANHTSCPYSFQFITCLIAHYGPTPRRAPFHGPRQRYLSQAFVRHLSSMCRQYNDYGSIRRDREEGTLNSVNFPEFWEEGSTPATTIASTRTPGGDDCERSEQAMKDDLMYVAEYERECCDRALEKLLRETVVDTRTRRILQAFVNVTDLYGQIYVQRDIASRVMRN